MAPPGPLSDVPVIEEPGVHASLEARPQDRAKAIRFIQGGHVSQRPATGFSLLRDAAAAWLTPALPLPINPRVALSA